MHSVQDLRVSNPTPVRRWSLISEVQQSCNLALADFSTNTPGGSWSLSSALVRPTLEGYEGSLKGRATAADRTDACTVIFSVWGVNGQTDLANLGATLTVSSFSVLGGATPTGTLSTDVSGQLLSSNGRIEVDLSRSGVATAVLQLTNLTDLATVTLETRVQAFGYLDVISDDEDRGT